LDRIEIKNFLRTPVEIITGCLKVQIKQVKKKRGKGYEKVEATVQPTKPWKLSGLLPKEAQIVKSITSPVIY